MPKYEITAPDGARYEVTAPSEAALTEAVGKMFGQQAPAQAPVPEAPEQVRGRSLLGGAQSALQGATAGWADEITGAIAAPFAFAGQDIAAGLGYGERPDARSLIGQTRQLAQDAYAPQREFAKENPWTDIGLQAGGAILSGTALGRLAAAAAPQTIARAAQIATRSPYLTAAGTGGVSGAVYGAGTAEEGQKAQGALTAGIGSAILGPAALYGVRSATPMVERAYGAIASKLAPQTDDALAAAQNALTARPENSAIRQLSTADRGASRLPPQPVPRDLSTLTTREGGIVPLTRGQRTQNADVQKLEQAAFEGDFGVAPRAQMREVRTIQNNQIKNFVSELGEAKDPRTVNDVVSKIGETINTQARGLNRRINSAYELARQGQSVRIGRDDLKVGLLQNIARTRREGGYDVSRMPGAAAVLRRLGGRVGAAPNTRITGVALGELEAVRTQATQAAMRSTDPTEKSFLRSIVRNYDSFMNDAITSAATEGDAAAISAFRNAVGLRRQYGQLFEQGNLAQSIVEGRGADDLVKDLFGSGVVSGRAEMAKNLQSIFTAAGPEAGAVKTDMQTAVMKRLFERSARGFEEGLESATGTPSDFISPAQLAKNLRQLISNPEFTKTLYGPQALPVLRTVTKDLELMANRQPGTINSSGTAQRVFEIMKNTGFINSIPGVGQIAALVRKGSELQAASRAAGTVSQGLGEIIRLSPELAPKSSFLTRNAGQQAATTGLAVGATYGQP